MGTNTHLSGHMGKRIAKKVEIYPRVYVELLVVLIKLKPIKVMKNDLCL